jgi:hypothetical protein
MSCRKGGLRVAVTALPPSEPFLAEALGAEDPPAGFAPFPFSSSDGVSGGREFPVPERVWVFWRMSLSALFAAAGGSIHCIRAIPTPRLLSFAPFVHPSSCSLVCKESTRFLVRFHVPRWGGGQEMDVDTALITALTLLSSVHASG